MKKKVLAVILAVVSVAALAACGSNGAAEPKADGSAATEKSSSTSADTTIKIGAKSFSESKILGELYALALEDAGYKVEREFEVSDNLIHQAVCDGQIDMYPEYTGTSLLTILDQPMETDPQITYDKVKEMYAEKNPDAKIEIVTMAQDDIVTKLNTSLSSGSYDGLPEIVLIEDYKAQGYLTSYQDLSLIHI